MADFIEETNRIKRELSELPLDPREKAYLENSVFPLIDLLYKLSNTSSSLAASLLYLSQSYTTKPKRGKIKKTEKTIYDINENCDILFKFIEKRIELIK